MALNYEWRIEDISASDNDPTSDWLDHIGSQHLAISGTSRPLYKTSITPTGKAVLRFDGVNDTLRETGDNIHNVKHMFIVAAFRPSSPVTNNMLWGDLAGQAYYAGDVVGNGNLVMSGGTFKINGVSTAVYPRNGEFAVYDFVFTSTATNLYLSLADYVLSYFGPWDICYVGLYDAELTGSTYTTALANLVTTYTRRDISFSASQASFALSGQNALLKIGRRVSSAYGAFALTGQSTNSRLTRNLISTYGSFVLTGQTAGLKANRLLKNAQTVYSTDSFTGSGLLDAHIPDSGPLWNIMSHPTEWIVQSNQLSRTAGTIDHAYMDIGVTDVEVTATFTQLNNLSALLARRSSILNMWEFYYDIGSNGWQLNKVVSGVDIPVGPILPGSTGTVTLRCVGNVITGIGPNGDSYTTIDTANGSNTQVGLILDGFAGVPSIVDDWSVKSVHVGSFGVSKKSVNLKYGHRVISNYGSFVESGQTVNLKYGHKITSAYGSLVLTGQSTSLLHALRLATDYGSFSLSGQSAGLLNTHRLIALYADYATTGQAAGLSKGFAMGGEYASFIETGQSARLVWNKILASLQGSFSLTGENAGLIASRVLNGLNGSFALTGDPAGLFFGGSVSGGIGNFTVTGEAVNLVRSFLLRSAIGSFDFTGQTAIFINSRLLAVSLGQFNLTGNPATFIFNRKLSGLSGSFSLIGEDVVMRLVRHLSTIYGSFSLSGQSAELLHDLILLTRFGVFTLDGQPTDLLADRTILASSGSITVTGTDILIHISRILMAIDGLFTLTGQDALLRAVRGLVLQFILDFNTTDIQVAGEDAYRDIEFESSTKNITF